jgi:hypothetical protein
MRFPGPTNDGVAFTKIDGDNVEHALNTNGQKMKKEWLKDKVNITCHPCGKKGQYANEYHGVNKPDKEPKATVVMAGVHIDDIQEADHLQFQFLMTGAHAYYRSVVLNQPSGAVPKV